MAADEFIGSLGSRKADKRRDMRPIHDVLLVDGDPQWYDVTRQQLEQHGFRVHHALDTGQADTLYRMQEPDFVLLEVILSGESGFELCHRLKRAAPRIPIMFLSVIDMDESRDLAARVGADAYATKPMEADDLKEMVYRVGRIAYDRFRKGNRTLFNIEFKCHHCNAHMRATERQRGRFVTCQKCGERANVPFVTENFRRDSYNFRRGEGSSQSSRFEPTDFVRVRCRDCGLRFALFKGKDLRRCPHCGSEQDGVVTMAKDPVAKAALISSRRVMVIHSGPNKGKKILLPTKRITIGQGEKCQLRLSDPALEDRHCTLKATDDGVVVQDLDTRTGTFVDEERIDGQHVLQPGEFLRVGEFRLQLALNKQLAQILSEPDEKQQKASGQSRRMKQASGTHRQPSDDPVADEAAEIIQRYWELLRQTTAET